MKAKSILKNIVLIAFFGSVTGCSFLPCPYYSDLKELKNLDEEELIGSYYSDDNSYAQNGQAELMIKKNKSFLLKNIPIAVLDVFHTDYKQDMNNLQAITGNWKIPKEQENNELITEIEYNKIAPEFGNISTTWELFEKDGQPVILIIIGDPDSCRALSFVKK